MKTKIFLCLILSSFILTACNEAEEVSDVEEPVELLESENEEVVKEQEEVQEDIEIVVNVPSVIGITKDELINVLGEPGEVIQDSVEIYVYENIEIGVDNGIVTTFYYEPTGLEFPTDNEKALESLGFEGLKEISHPIEVPNKAYKVEGYDQISVFGKFKKPAVQYEGEKIPIDYVYIKK